MSPILREIEQSIRALSIEEQLWLLERIAHELRQKTQFAALPIAAFDMEKQLADMASDPAIQAELIAIEQEKWMAWSNNGHPTGSNLLR